MKHKKLRMVTVVAETILEDRLCEQALALGATGYTVCESRGTGSFGRNAGEIPGTNVRIEFIVEEKIAEKIVASISREYFNNYSIICFLSDVHVVREAKYSATGTAEKQEKPCDD